jgi:hypothetical protein
MSIITKAMPSALVNLGPQYQIPALAQDPTKPCILTIPGSAGLELQNLTLTATGSVQPNQAGEMHINILALPYIPNTPPPTLSTLDWLIVASCTPEPIGGSGDPVRTQWMVQGTRMLYYLNRGGTDFSAQLPNLTAAGTPTGKLQGEFLSNIADHPVPAEDMDTNQVQLYAGVDPVMLFTLSFYLDPTAGFFTATPVVHMKNFWLTGDA